MQYFAGLDVSLEETSVCVVDGKGRVVREARVASDPKAIRRFLKGTGWGFERVGLEAGPLAPWLYRGLVEGGLPAVCLETRRMKAFASASPVKTDRKDAGLIAQAVRVGLYQAVHIKSPSSHERRVGLQCRHALQGQVVLTRVGADNWLTQWGRKPIPKRGFKRACVAVARRLAVIMHRMWLDGSHFQAWRPTPAAA